ncbi:CBS domain-containing protein [Lichenicoccus roseus]|uniref:CBS domain-containing protein n=1 Tax=Lichenicoccus roseus TaxID=2683649 RepID=A0A5R9J236_9PROT|nr:CBS domain-containing protein [Lichenicoccus roseus]TLU70923.1 CBS domain-containing protein [Lichenicoccus roseus]
MTIASIIRNKSATIIKVAPQTLISEVVQVLAEHKIGAVLVMDGRDLRGVLSERDIVRAMARQPSGVRALTAENLMTPPRALTKSDASIASVMQIMTEKRVRHLPVIEDGVVVGVVSIGDVVKALLDQQSVEVETMRAYVVGAA